MKKAFPLIIAAIVFVVALVLLRPAPSRTVVTAAYDLRAGHVLQEEDLTLMSVPEPTINPSSVVPAINAAARFTTSSGAATC